MKKIFTILLFGCTASKKAPPIYYPPIDVKDTVKWIPTWACDGQTISSKTILFIATDSNYSKCDSLNH
jgi:hypothetical protein